MSSSAVKTSRRTSERHTGLRGILRRRAGSGGERAAPSPGWKKRVARDIVRRR
jgi:hypothetical protein